MWDRRGRISSDDGKPESEGETFIIEDAEESKESNEKDAPPPEFMTSCAGNSIVASCGACVGGFEGGATRSESRPETLCV